MDIFPHVIKWGSMRQERGVLVNAHRVEQDQRAFPRAMITLPVTLSLDGKSGNAVYKGTMENIGGGGVCLRLDRKVWERLLDHSAPLLESALHISIPLPISPHPISASGRIVWSMGVLVRREEYYKIGVAFTKISEEERGKIISLVSQSRG